MRRAVIWFGLDGYTAGDALVDAGALAALALCAACLATWYAILS